MEESEFQRLKRIGEIVKTQLDDKLNKRQLNKDTLGTWIEISKIVYDLAIEKNETKNEIKKAEQIRILLAFCQRFIPKPDASMPSYDCNVCSRKLNSMVSYDRVILDDKYRTEYHACKGCYKQLISNLEQDYDGSFEIIHDCEFTKVKKYQDSKYARMIAGENSEIIRKFIDDNSIKEEQLIPIIDKALESCPNKKVFETGYYYFPDALQYIVNELHRLNKFWHHPTQTVSSIVKERAKDL